MRNNNSVRYFTLFASPFSLTRETVLKKIVLKFQFLQIATSVRSPLLRGETGRRGVKKLTPMKYRQLFI
jgi:hypothetical protein